jgi:predicted Zn finger-like uncharacterized protein
MSILLTCPRCHSAYEVDDDLRGRKVRCRECDEPVRVGPEPAETEHLQKEEPPGQPLPVAASLSEAEELALLRRRLQRRGGRRLLIALVALLLLAAAAGAGAVWWSGLIYSPPTNADPVTRALYDLRSPWTQHRWEGAERLRKILPSTVSGERRAEVARALEERLNDRVTMCRESAIKALCVWATAENVPALIQALNEEGLFRRTVVIETLG